MNTNFNMTELQDKAKNFLTSAGKIAVIVAAITIGAIGRDIYVKVSDATGKGITAYQQPKHLSETSIALNERGELMIINRRTGEFQLFQDSVGKVVFNMYAAQLYVQKTEQ